MAQLSELLKAGMTVARFDFTTGSGTLQDQQTTLDNLREAQKQTKSMCAVYCSLRGNVYAVSKRNSSVVLDFKSGQTVRLVHGQPVCDGTDVLPLGSGVVKSSFPEHFMEGDTVLVHPFLRAGEKTAELVVESVSEHEVLCKCVNDAAIDEDVKQVAVDFTRGSRQVNATVTAADEAVIKQFAVPAKVDFISFGAIRNGKTLAELRRCMKEWGLPNTRLIAQLDNLHALRDLQNVLKNSDVLLLARGELGAVVEPEKMFAVQKRVLRMCEAVGRPCIVTRLMDSMIFAPRPTRAEATDIANIVLDGADGLLLGLETLEGNFPVNCLETVLNIAREADAVYDYEARYRRQMQQINVKLAKATAPDTPQPRQSSYWGAAQSLERATSGYPPPRQRANSITVRLEQFEPQVNLKKEALAAAAVQTAYQIEAKLIVVFSHTGETTRLVAKYHPKCPVLSMSIPQVRGGTLKWQVEGDVEARQQLVLRGVVPALSVGQPSIDEVRRPIQETVGATRTDVEAMLKAAELGLIKLGDLAVVCQLISGLSTVKVIEFTGMKKPKSRTFSPFETRSSSPASIENEKALQQSHAMGHIGTVQDLMNLNIKDVASHPSFASLAEETAEAKDEYFAPM